MFWPFKEVKNESFFCIISQESTHLRVMYLGCAIAQTEGSPAFDFTATKSHFL